MMKSQRVRKQTEKGAEYSIKNKHQLKKKQREILLQKRIEKQKAIIEKALEEEIEADEDFVEVIRDENNKIFKDLYFNNDKIAKDTRYIISQYPSNFLPDIFKGLIPLLVERRVEQIKVKVLYKDLLDGKYHTKSSKSDKGIATGIKTLLKIQDLQQYDKEDLTDLINNHRKVFYEILKIGLEKKHSISTIKGNVVRLVRLLFIAYGNKKTTPIYAKYAIIMKKMGGKQEALDSKNQLNDNEAGRYLEWKYVLQEQKKIQEHFNAIVNKKTKEAYNINLNLILVSLYCKTPPLRQEVMALQFKKQGDNDDADYVYFKRNETILDLNLDKKRHPPIDITLNSELSNILKQSYELYPRKHLFTDPRLYPIMDKPVKIATVADRLRRIFIKYGVNIGPSILRASYSTTLFSKLDWSMTEVDEAARLMRTSAKYILRSYRKAIKEDNINVKEVNKNIVLRPLDINELIKIKQEPTDDDNRPIHKQIIKEDPYKVKNDKLVKKYNNNDEYRNKVLEQQKKYREIEGAFKIQRRKTIALLKKSEAYRNSIKPDTLKKYDIKPDEYM